MERNMKVTSHDDLSLSTNNEYEMDDDARQPDTSHVQTKPTLLSLPPELRLIVYNFVLRGACIRPNGMNLRGEDIYALRAFPTGNIILVNRLISDEAQPLFWQLVTLDTTRTPGQISRRIQPGLAWQRSCSLTNLYMRAQDLAPCERRWVGEDPFPHNLDAELMRGRLKMLTFAESVPPIRQIRQRTPDLPYEETARKEMERVLSSTERLRWVPEVRVEFAWSPASHKLVGRFQSIAEEVLVEHDLEHNASFEIEEDAGRIVCTMRKSRTV